jgi:hypothetical protein
MQNWTQKLVTAFIEEGLVAAARDPRSSIACPGASTFAPLHQVMKSSKSALGSNCRFQACEKMFDGTGYSN